MPKGRRKSDVFALRPGNNDSAASNNLNKKSSSSRRKTISFVDMNHPKNLENQENRENDMTNHSQMSLSSIKATPSKQRVNLGSASNFYFKNLPKTPLQKMVSSARKKHHTTQQHQQSLSSKKPAADVSYLSNSSASSAEDVNNDSLNSSTDLAIRELKQMLDTSQVSAATKESSNSMNSEFSISDSSSGASSSDAMNRSVLSDTTELTASNFVFTATSKQCLLDFANQEKKNKKQQQKQQEKENHHSKVSSLESTSQKAAGGSTRAPLGELKDDRMSPKKLKGMIDASPSPGFKLPALPKPASVEKQNSVEKPRNNVDDQNYDHQNEEQQLSQEAQSQAVASSMSQSSESVQQQEEATSAFATSLQSAKKPTVSLLRSRIQVSPKSIRKFTDSLKKNRLQRKFEKKQDIKRRLSMGSAMKNAAPPPLPPSEDGKIAARLSTGSVANSTTSRPRKSMGSEMLERRSSLGSDGDSTGELNLSQWHLSSKLAQSPFDSSRGTPSHHEENGMLSQTSADEIMYENDDTAEINFEYHKWIREPIHTKALDDPAASVQNSNSAIMLRRFSRSNDNQEGYGDQDMNDELSAQIEASKTSSTSSHDVQEAIQEESEESKTAEQDESAASKSSIEKMLDGIELDESRVNSKSGESNSNKSSASSISTRSSQKRTEEPHTDMSPASNTGRESGGDTGDRRSSLPGEIVFPSQESQVSPEANNTHTSSAPTSPVTTSSSPLLNRRPGSASKLTPTRLSKKPRLVVNPDSLLSPARNTRSAKKKMQSDVPDSSAGSEPVASTDSGNQERRERRESTAPSVATRGSGGSVTASLGDLREVLEMADYDMQDEDGDVNQNNRARRETANVSDFGEMMQYFDEENDSTARRSSVHLNARRRRSSMYRSSLASLPEQGALADVAQPSNSRSPSDGTASLDDLKDIFDDDTIASSHAQGSGRESNRRRSSVLSPNPDSEKGDIEDKGEQDHSKEEASHSESLVQEGVEEASDKSKDGEEEETIHSKKSTADSSTASASDLAELFGDSMSGREPDQNQESQGEEAIKFKSPSDRSTSSALASGDPMVAVINSPARNTRSSTKKQNQVHSVEKVADPKVAMMNSPARNTRSSSKKQNQVQSVEKNADSTEDHSSAGRLSGALNGESPGSSTESPSNSVNRAGASDASSQRERRDASEEDGQSASLSDIEGMLESPKESACETTEETTSNSGLKRERSSPASQRQTKKSKCNENDAENVLELHSSNAVLETAGLSRVHEEGIFTSPDQQQDTGGLGSQMSSMKSAQQRGVLSSALKKPRFGGEKKSLSEAMAKKTVGFRSPEAAEYDIGSTSMRYTPMPKNQAKALFSIPSPSDSMSEGSSVATYSPTNKQPSDDILQTEERTVTLELNMNQLMENLGEASEMAPSATHPDVQEAEDMDESSESENSVVDHAKTYTASDDNTVELETSLNGLFANAIDEQGNQIASKSSSGSPGEGRTVELESSVNGLLKTVAQETEPPNDTLDSEIDGTDQSPSSSVEKADAECIVSANAAVEGGNSQESFDGQMLNFESPSPTSNNGNSTCAPDDQTIELEMNMEAFLDTVGTESKKLNRLDVSAIPPSSPSETGSPLPYESSRTGEEHSLRSFASPGSAFVSVKPCQEATVRLENNVQELFAATLMDTERSTVQSYDPSTSFATDKGTVELEENMAVVLKSNTRDSTHSPTLEFDDQGTSDSRSRRSRRSSISSHRFSLAPEGRLSVSKDGNVSIQELSEDSSNELDHRIEGAQEQHDEALVEEETATLDLTCNEIFDAASFQLDDSSQEIDFAHEDVIVAVERIFQDLQIHSVSNEFSKFINAVCTELENNAEEIPNIDETFAEKLQENAEALFVLQEKIRYPQEGSDLLKDILDSLAAATMKSKEYEFMSWQAAALEHLEGPIDTIIQNLDGEQDDMERWSNRIDEGREFVCKMADVTARSARRKSMNRRKATATSIEDEIQQLEAEIARSKADLEGARKAQYVASEKKSMLAQNQSDAKLLSATRMEAEKSRSRLTTLEGIFRWSPVKLTEQCMSFITLSPSPESSLAISFDIPNVASQIRCRAKIDPTLYRHRLGHTRKLTQSSAKFLKNSISAQLRRSASVRLNDPTDIPQLLQRLDWNFGRLEQTAFELGKLEKRFGASIVFVDEKVYLEVEIQRRQGAGAFQATIELCPAYPFSPLNLQVDVLEGDIDVKALQRKLVKQAKPGFDYLTRTCECMSTFISSS